MIKNHYKEFTLSMKVLFWVACVLTLFGSVWFFLMLFSNILPRGIFHFVPVIVLLVSGILILVLAAMMQVKNQQEKK